MVENSKNRLPQIAAMAKTPIQAFRLAFAEKNELVKMKKLPVPVFRKFRPPAESVQESYKERLRKNTVNNITRCHSDHFECSALKPSLVEDGFQSPRQSRTTCKSCVATHSNSSAAESCVVQVRQVD